MKLHDLQCFLEVCACKSFNQAAQSLYISRPALVRTINGLEAQLNRQLFSRSTVGVELTEFGRFFYGQAVAAVQQLERLQELPQEFDRSFGKYIRFGVRGNFRGAYQIEQSVKEFQKQYPFVHVELIGCNSETLRCLVLEGRLDMGYAILMEDDGLVRVPLQELPFSILMNRSHPLAQSTSITPEALRDQPIMVSAYSQHPIDKLQQYMSSYGYEPKILFSTVDVGLVCQTVLRDNVLGIMLKRDAELVCAIHPELMFLDMPGAYNLVTGLIYKKDNVLTSEQKLLVRFLEKRFSGQRGAPAAEC